MPSRDALERIWRGSWRDDASPVYVLAITDSPLSVTQLWWIKSVAGQHEGDGRWPVWQTPLAACRQGRYEARSRRRIAPTAKEEVRRHSFLKRRAIFYDQSGVTVDVN